MQTQKERVSNEDRRGFYLRRAVGKDAAERITREDQNQEHKPWYADRRVMDAMGY